MQTPTLGLVVARDEAIENHVTRKFYELTATGGCPDTDSQPTFKFKPGKDMLAGEKHVFDAAPLETIKAKMDGSDATFTTVISEKTENPPLPYNLTVLLSDMSERFGFTAAKTQQITQDLRDKYKAITYNRSDSQYLKEEHFAQAPAVLAQAMENVGATWPLDYSIHSKAFNEKNVTAHHGIIPQEIEAPVGDMTEDEVKVYTAIVERYAAQFLPPAVYDVSTSSFDAEGGTFQAVSTRLREAGFKSVYKDLIPGKEYKVVGKLMLKDTGEPLLDADGKPVTAEATFTPDHDHGTVDVTFTFDASLLAGEEVVAFETLYRLDKVITAHADIEDEKQTVEVIQPAVDTVAVDGFDGDKDVVADPEARITDTLSYKNVIPGSTYEVHGIVMDAETGLPLLSGEGADKVGEDDLTDFWHELCDLTGVTSAKPLDGGFDLFASIGGIFGQSDEGDDGEEVWFPQVEPDWDGIDALLEDNPEIADHLSTATETFEADKDHGEIEMDFGLDASDLAGKKAVVFELLVKDGIAVGAHSDLTDEDQTVTIVPSTIGTEATDKTDGDHEVMVSKEVTIVDAVHYENLLPGKEYTVKGVLMDKSTDKPLMVGDKKVEASASFTPNKPNGTVELEFTFDATGLEDKEVVAFETLYKDGIEVATHADIDDAAQTVKFVKPPKGGVYDKTGNMLSGYGWVAALLVVAAVAGAGYAGKQYLDARKEKDGDADGGES